MRLLGLIGIRKDTLLKFSFVEIRLPFFLEPAELKIWGLLNSNHNLSFKDSNYIKRKTFLIYEYIDSEKCTI